MINFNKDIIYNFLITNSNDIFRSEKLVKKIIHLINKNGGYITFDKYMNVVLYEKKYGYYNNLYKNKVNYDFITSPNISLIFSKTIALAILDFFKLTKTSSILEIGSGNGYFAIGILSFFYDLKINIEKYVIYDISNTSYICQYNNIKDKIPHMIKYVEWVKDLPNKFNGIIIANEVLDAMPVKLVLRKDNEWYERVVTIKNNIFYFKDNLIYSNCLDKFLFKLNFIKSNFYLTEIHTKAIYFVENIFKILRTGIIIFIDYGFPRHEYYHEQRDNGTLMCHYRNKVHNNPFLYPGLQDITSHIDFTSIYELSLKNNIDLLVYTSQANFLINCGILDILKDYMLCNNKNYSMINSVNFLLSESEMGELFKVILFSKGVNIKINKYIKGNRINSLLIDKY